MSLSRLALLLALYALAASIASAAEDPFTGTWTLDPKFSRFPGEPPIREDFIYEAGDDGAVTFRVVEVTTRGTVTAEWQGRFDGVDYPMSGAPGRDTLGMVRVHDDVILGVYKDQSGRVSYAFTRALSDGGRTMTSRVLGATPDGRAIDVMIVHRKE